MHTLDTAADIDAVIGIAPKMINAKVVHTLDEGCREVFARSPVAGFGLRDAAGVLRTTVVGGSTGFARAESGTRLSLPWSGAGPARGLGVSMTFLLPGVGETFRLNGTVADGGAGAGRVLVDVDEAFVHCARCVLRSKLWTAAAVPGPAVVAEPGDGPLAAPGVTGFLATSPFGFVTSCDATGRSDTSPRGDEPAFVRVLDGATLALPDRRGNRRADTLRNLVACPDIALVALVPGRADAVHVTGSAHISTDPDLLATMALRGKAPHAAVVVRVHDALLRPAPALDRLWSAPGDELDLNAIAARHVAANSGRAMRVLSKGLGAAPGLTRRALEAVNRSALRDEGY